MKCPYCGSMVGEFKARCPKCGRVLPPFPKSNLGPLMAKKVPGTMRPSVRRIAKEGER